MTIVGPSKNLIFRSFVFINIVGPSFILPPSRVLRC